jgi:ADP-ribosyl-[dinitrogen reductase] hydrolase
MTKVVNVKTDKYDIYIGRQMGFGKYPQSIYHNPFKTGSLGCENVGDAVKLYYHYIMSDKGKELREKLPVLKGLTLGCWCKDKAGNGACHGDVLVYLLEGTMSPELSGLIPKVSVLILKVGKNIDRIRGAILGLCLGDALGVPHEFNYCKFKYTGKLEHAFIHKNWRQPSLNKTLAVGAYSDDTEMMLCLLRSLIDNKGYVFRDVADSYIRWASSGQCMMGTNTRELFKSGTKQPIMFQTYVNRFEKKNKVTVANPFTSTSEEAEGRQSNGALMRCLPLAFIGGELNLKAIMEDVWCTNPSSIAYWAEFLHLYAVRMAIEGSSALEIWNKVSSLCMESAPPKVKQVFTDISEGKMWPLDKDSNGIKVKGWVLTSFFMSMKALAFKASNPQLTYAEIMAWVIEAGGDTDTNAAIVGGLIGAIEGYEKLILVKQNYDNILIMMNSTSGNVPSDVPRAKPYQILDIIELCDKVSLL